MVSYVCLSLTSESILSVQSFLSITTVTLPSSAGRMIDYVFVVFSRFNASSSSSVKFQSVSETDYRVEGTQYLRSSFVDSGSCF